MTLHCYLFFALTILQSVTISLLCVSARSLPIPKLKPWALYNFTNSHPGQNYKGLSNVKNYFHRFGYIPNVPPSNFTDDFDNTLITAIQTYQKNYNLKVTGVLDDNTLQHMALPRCGVPDIINNKRSTTMSFGNHKLHFHMISHYAFFNGIPRWPVGTQQLTYAFSPENKLNIEYKGAFARAFNRWTPVVKITFQETPSYETANIKIAFLRGNHGDGYAFDGAVGMSSSVNTLAHAFAPTDGRFHLDADEAWVASGDVTQSKVETAIDLESVAVHEIGHLLGLEHSFDEKAVMYATIPPRTRKVELAEDDILGIQKLYGIKTN